MRVGATEYEVRNAVRERIGFARAGAGDHQQGARDAVGRTDIVLDGGALLRIEAGVGIFREDGDGDCRHGGHSNGKLYNCTFIQLYSARRFPVFRTK